MKNGSRFRGIFDNAAVGIGLFDSERKLERANSALCDLLGYTEEELKGCMFDSWTHQDDLEPDRSNYDLLMEGAFKSYNVEKRYRTKDGSYGWVRVTRSVLLDEQTGRKYSVSIVENIAARKHAEEEREHLLTELQQLTVALRESEKRIRAIFDNAGVGIVEVTEADRFVAANRRICDMLGYSLKELCAMDVHELTAPEDRSLSDEMNRQVHEGLLPVASYDKRYLKKDGTRLWVHVNVSAIQDEEGKWVRSVTTVEDISLRKAAEDDLRRTIVELERSNRELQQFAYVSSHDLQEPLRIVMVYAGLLRDRYKDKLDANGDKYIRYMHEASERMSTLITDLLAFSRVGFGTQSFESVELESVLNDALKNLTVAIGESHAEVMHDKLPVVHGNYEQLVQLFQNLLANSLKYVKKDVTPRIAVTVEHQLHQWVIGVHDNGIGIDPEFFERIFIIFQRLHKREEYSGTGIGLAMCRKIVERHGGRIWVESKPGEGSYFYFTLPAGNKYIDHSRGR